MRTVAGIAAALAVTAVVSAVWASVAIDLDVTVEDVERALTIARSTEAERARFHAPYISAEQTAVVERAEIVSEFRRIVLTAEERMRAGDRSFGYSATRAADAVQPWKRRVALAVRLRFHPQNTYVTLPEISVSVEGIDDDALIGVTADPVLALPPGRSGEFVPLLGARIEAVFDAVAIGQATRMFVIHLAGREVGRVTFELGALD